MAARAVARLPVRGGLRAVRAEQLHITLAFVAELPEDRLGDACDAVAAAAAGRAPCALSLGRLGAFTRRGRPAAVWLDVVDGRAEVLALAGAVREALAGRGIASDPAPVEPHLTLARVGSRATAEDLRALGAALAEDRAVPLTFTVRTVELVESVLTPVGPRYALRQQVRLEGER